MKKLGVFFIVLGIIWFILIGTEAYITGREKLELFILLIGVLPICIGISIIKNNNNK